MLNTLVRMLGKPTLAGVPKPPTAGGLWGAGEVDALSFVSCFARRRSRKASCVQGPIKCVSSLRCHLLCRMNLTPKHGICFVELCLCEWCRAHIISLVQFVCAESLAFEVGVWVAPDGGHVSFLRMPSRTVHVNASVGSFVIVHMNIVLVFESR